MRSVAQSGDIMRGAFILTGAAIIVKILSAVYRVPFQNIVGDVGFYIYQQVYPFYGIALVLSTYGFPVVISKLYAEQHGSDQAAERRILYTAAFVLGIFGVISFVLLYGASDWLAMTMGDVELAALLKATAFVFLFLPGIALMRGFFQGKGDMVPTAISQIGEQSVRVIFILAAAYWMTNNSYSLYKVGSGAFVGSAVGAVVSLLILVFFFMKRQRSTAALKNTSGLHLRESIKIGKSILIQGFAICVSSLLLIFLQLADSLNLYVLLMDSGLNNEAAKALKGIYDRGQPLIQLGTVVATSMSLSLVPLITKAQKSGNEQFFYRNIDLAYRIAVFVGSGATVGLMVIIRPVNMMLFENSDGSHVLAVLSVTIVLCSLIITSSAVLQGFGHTFFPALIIVCGFLCKYLLNMVLVPQFAIMGAAIATCLTLLLILVIMVIRLRVILKKTFTAAGFLAKNAAAALLMLVVLTIYIYLTDLLIPNAGRLYASFQALSGVMLGGSIYVITILRGNTFKEEELALLPFGSKLIFLLPNRKRRKV